MFNIPAATATSDFQKDKSTSLHYHHPFLLSIKLRRSTESATTNISHHYNKHSSRHVINYICMHGKIVIVKLVSSGSKKCMCVCVCVCVHIRMRLYVLYHWAISVPLKASKRKATIRNRKLLAIQINKQTAAEIQYSWHALYCFPIWRQNLNFKWSMSHTIIQSCLPTCMIEHYL